LHNLPAADLDTYLARIDYAGELRPDAATLARLHLAHATRIPFENLDVLLGRPIRLDLASLHAKLVGRARGGYCFEHNLLFASVLRTLGFAVTTLAARVHYRTTLTLPRTHMLLQVHADGADWLTDVGFGGEGLLLPVPLRQDRGNPQGEPSRQFAWTYRAAELPGTEMPRKWMLQSLRDGAWVDLYAFTREPQELADYEMANYWVSTHPSSRFVQTLTVQLPGAEVRHVLRDRELTQDRGSTETTRTITDAEVPAVLGEIFGLHLEPGTRLFPPPRGAA
jgi:N-hydroxyarylamine O-acetyltransferase